MNPEIEKITVNTGLTDKKQEQEKKEQIEESLALITGQKPIPTEARKSISSFGISQGDEIGYKVTLRGKKKQDFFEKIVKIVLPRTKDFSGINPDSSDDQGNLTIGFPDVKVFPALKEKHELPDYGLEVTIVTPQDNPKQAIEFLKKKGMPIKEFARKATPE